MQIKQFTFNPFQENTYLLYDESGDCVIVDCGCSTPQEEQELVSFITEQSLVPKHSIYTHLHFDHVLGAGFLKQHYGLEPEAHEGDEFFYVNTKELAMERFGIALNADVPPIAVHLKEGSFQFGDSSLELLHVPGHSPGSLVFYSAQDHFAIVGDVIFRASIGRTDLWGGNFELLVAGIKEKLLTLPDQTTFYSGHGMKTTVNYEKQNNSFLI